MLDSISEIDEHLKKWKSIRRSVIKPLEKHIAYRPLFNVDFFREALLYRYIELAESAILLYRADSLIGAIISVRSVQETTALMWYLNEKLRIFSETKDLQFFLEKMNRLSFGWSKDDEFPEKINILTCIDSVDKMYEGKFRKIYDVMSEYAHPNYSGVLGTYKQADHQTLDVQLGYTAQSVKWMNEIILSALSGVLMMLEPITETYETFFNKCLDVCLDLHEQGKLSDIYYKRT